MSLKQLIEVRSVTTGRFTVRDPIAGDVATADFWTVPRAVRVMNKVAKAFTIGHPGADITNINRALREPQEPERELTVVDAIASTL